MSKQVNHICFDDNWILSKNEEEVFILFFKLKISTFYEIWFHNNREKKYISIYTSGTIVKKTNFYDCFFYIKQWFYQVIAHILIF